MASKWAARLELQPCAVDELPGHLDRGTASHRGPPGPCTGAPKEACRASAPVFLEGFMALLQVVQPLTEAQHLLKDVALQPLQRIDVLPAKSSTACFLNMILTQDLQLCSLQQTCEEAKMYSGNAKPKKGIVLNSMIILSSATVAAEASACSPQLAHCILLPAEGKEAFDLTERPILP